MAEPYTCEGITIIIVFSRGGKINNDQLKINFIKLKYELWEFIYSASE
jgi:hypothetical protein